MKSAVFCDQCKHYDVDLLDEKDRGSPCSVGHKPRFYIPATIMQSIYQDWGFKRRCQDFELSEAARQSL